MSFEQGETLGRRDFLRLSGAAVGGAIIGDALYEIVAPADKWPPSDAIDVVKFQQAEAIFVEGDLPTPIPMSLEGWKVVTDDSAVRNTPDEFKDAKITVAVVNSGDSVTARPSMEFQGGHMVNPGTSYPDPDNPSNVVYEMSARPNQFGDPSYLIYWVDTGTPEGQQIGVVPLLPKTYTDREPGEGGYPSVISETDLGEDKIREIVELKALFTGFHANTTIIIPHTKNKDDRGGTHNPYAHEVTVHDVRFTEPKVPGEGLMAVFHEQSHGVFQNFIDNQRDQECNFKMWQAYKGFVESAGFDYPLPNMMGAPAELEYSSYFSTIDESEYINEPAGHPYDSHNEMFASAMTVFHFFPDEFIQRYNTASPKRQRALSTVIEAVFDLLQTANEDEAALKRLIPKADELRALAA